MGRSQKNLQHSSQYILESSTKKTGQDRTGKMFGSDSSKMIINQSSRRAAKESIPVSLSSSHSSKQKSTKVATHERFDLNNDDKSDKNDDNEVNGLNSSEKWQASNPNQKSRRANTSPQKTASGCNRSLTSNSNSSKNSSISSKGSISSSYSSSSNKSSKAGSEKLQIGKIEGSSAFNNMPNEDTEAVAEVSSTKSRKSKEASKPVKEYSIGKKAATAHMIFDEDEFEIVPSAELFITKSTSKSIVNVNSKSLSSSANNTNISNTNSSKHSSSSSNNNNNNTITNNNINNNQSNSNGNIGVFNMFMSSASSNIIPPLDLGHSSAQHHQVNSSPLLLLVDLNGTILCRSRTLISEKQSDLKAANTNYYFRKGYIDLFTFLFNLQQQGLITVAFYTSMTSRYAYPAVQHIVREVNRARMFANARAGKSVQLEREAVPYLFDQNWNKWEPTDTEPYAYVRDLTRLWSNHCSPDRRCSLETCRSAASPAFGFSDYNTIMIDDTTRKMKEFPDNLILVDTFDEGTFTETHGNPAGMERLIRIITTVVSLWATAASHQLPSSSSCSNSCSSCSSSNSSSSSYMEISDHGGGKDVRQILRSVLPSFS